MLSPTLVLEVGIAVFLVAVVGLLASKLRFSVIPFFIIIGMVVGQHAPQIGYIDLTFTESKPFIDFMGRLGVLFLLFYLGLEFSVGRLMQSGKSIITGGTIYVFLNFISGRSEEHTSELQSRENLVCRRLRERKN